MNAYLLRQLRYDGAELANTHSSFELSSLRVGRVQSGETRLYQQAFIEV